MQPLLFFPLIIFVPFLVWYRQPRFMNRGNKGKGWLAPSIDHKLQTHIRLIEKLKKILPISDIIIEVVLLLVAFMA